MNMNFEIERQRKSRGRLIFLVLVFTLLAGGMAIVKGAVDGDGALAGFGVAFVLAAGFGLWIFVQKSMKIAALRDQAGTGTTPTTPRRRVGTRS